MTSTTLVREIREGLQRQGKNEIISYKLVLKVGTTPTSPVVIVYDVTDLPLDDPTNWVDVTATIASGLPTVVSNIIYTPLLRSMTVGKKYRVQMKYVSNGNTFEPFAYIICDP